MVRIDGGGGGNTDTCTTVTTGPPQPVVAESPAQNAVLDTYGTGSEAIVVQPASAPLELVECGAAGTVSMRNPDVPSASGGLPTEKQAISDLKAILPGITEALDIMVAGAGQSSDDPVCDKAAGLVLGKLRELGYDARLVDSGLHITVRVRTQGGDVIVDPTMSQFFTDGSPTDRLLLAKGGFVGTEGELTAFVQTRHQDWNGEMPPTESAAEFRAGVEQNGRVTRSEWRAHLREHFLPDFSAQAMTHFTEKNFDGALTPSANAVAEAYQHFRDTGEASDYGCAAYERLARVERPAPEHRPPARSPDRR